MPVRLVVPVLLASAMLVDAGIFHARAATALERLGAEQGERAATEVSLSVGDERVPASFYPSPTGRGPGVVLLHGIHRLGKDEPRLVSFAKMLSNDGIHVMVPALDALTDYRVDAISVPTIDAASRELARRIGRPRVGVMGFCFAGGLALVAASRPETSRAIGAVITVGAHEDLGRVTRFFASGQAEPPRGAARAMRPHDYGALVFAYGHVERIFSPEDAPIARETIRLKLWEEHEASQARAKALSPEGEARFASLVSGDGSALAPIVASREGPLAAAFEDASPRGKLHGLRVPVYVLHGEADSVIPSTEAEWLEAGIGPSRLRQVLVSPLIQHVELHGEPSVLDKAKLVHFFAQVMAELERL